MTTTSPQSSTPTAAAGTVQEVLAAETKPLLIDANQPLLATGNAVWLVQTGQVHVFAVRVENGAERGARRYLFSVPAGGALFGVAPASASAGHGLLAVGGPHTALL